jgi:ribosomal protein S27E
MPTRKSPKDRSPEELKRMAEHAKKMAQVRKRPPSKEMKFETPDKTLYCEKCGTTNYIYSGMKMPYTCDNCGGPL